ncbi:MAG: neutral zinc metallopeptidase [Pseudomonadota bacterium]
MRLRNIRRSSNVIDARGRRSGGGGGRGGGLGVVGLLIVLAVGWYTGIDVRPLLGVDGRSVSSTPAPRSPGEDRAADFASRVLTTTEAVWADVFSKQLGEAYQPPELVLFTGNVQSACGGGSAAMGPFYCPADRRAYLDLSFFDTLANRLGAEGDFAAAYVIGHEVAHHVQNVLGVMRQTAVARAKASPRQANEISVRTELQADCLAGIWAGRLDGLLEPGDVQEALNAARQIGDDTLARNAGRAVQPHTFTHGSSDQRERWFARGYKSGLLADCDTFSATRL